MSAVSQTLRKHLPLFMFILPEGPGPSGTFNPILSTQLTYPLGGWGVGAVRRKPCTSWGAVLCCSLTCKQVGLGRLLLAVPANLTVANLGKAAQTQRFTLEGRKALPSEGSKLQKP